MKPIHHTTKVIKRSSGRSAVASAAYRAGEKIKNKKDGVVHDYTRKGEVDSSEIMAPDDAPDWVYDRDELWNSVELVEKRKDAQLAREVEISLPVELDPESQKKLIRAHVKECYVSKGMVADISFHKIGGSNPHAHIMLSMRTITKDGWGKKEREWNKHEHANLRRKDWATRCNIALEESGVQGVEYTEKSYAELGINQIPTRHMGPRATALEKKGVRTERGDINRQIRAVNEELKRIDKELAEVQKEIDSLATLRGRISPIAKLPDTKLKEPKPPIKSDTITKKSISYFAKEALSKISNKMNLVIKRFNRTKAAHEKQKQLGAETLQRISGDYVRRINPINQSCIAHIKKTGGPISRGNNSKTEKVAQDIQDSLIKLNSGLLRASKAVVERQKHAEQQKWKALKPKPSIKPSPDNSMEKEKEYSLVEERQKAREEARIQGEKEARVQAEKDLAAYREKLPALRYKAAKQMHAKWLQRMADEKLAIKTFEERVNSEHDRIKKRAKIEIYMAGETIKEAQKEIGLLHANKPQPPKLFGKHKYREELAKWHESLQTAQEKLSGANEIRQRWNTLNTHSIKAMEAATKAAEQGLGQPKSEIDQFKARHEQLEVIKSDWKKEAQRQAIAAMTPAQREARAKAIDAELDKMDAQTGKEFDDLAGRVTEAAKAGGLSASQRRLSKETVKRAEKQLKGRNRKMINPYDKSSDPKAHAGFERAINAVKKAQNELGMSKGLSR